MVHVFSKWQKPNETKFEQKRFTKKKVSYRKMTKGFRIQTRFEFSKLIKDINSLAS